MHMTSGQMLLLRHLINGLNNLDKTDSEYSLAHSDDLIRFCRSKLKGEGHTVVWWKYAVATASIWGVEVCVLVYFL